MDGGDDWAGKYANQPGCCQWVSPGTTTRSKSASTASNASGCSGARLGQLGPDVAGLGGFAHRPAAEPSEIVGHPVDQGVSVAPERFQVEGIGRSGRPAAADRVPESAACWSCGCAGDMGASI